MKGVILDADSLGNINLEPIINCFDSCDVHPTTADHEISQRIAPANVVLSNKIQLDKSALNQAKNLQFISVMATGTNNIDLSAAANQGIQVSNARAYSTPSVVQHTINLMLTLSTNLPNYLRDVKEGAWHKSNVFTMLHHPIIELSGKTLGIIGYGDLGSNVSVIAKAFGMDIKIAARNKGESSANRLDLNTLLPSVDFLSLHCPLTESNANLINSQTLSLMKPTAFLINTARGGLVNSEDLISALKNGLIAGAAIDVLNHEPPNLNDPLLKANLQNLLITPHNAWGALESRERLVVQMKENIECYKQGKPIRLVN